MKWNWLGLSSVKYVYVFSTSKTNYDRGLLCRSEKYFWKKKKEIETGQTQRHNVPVYIYISEKRIEMERMNKTKSKVVVNQISYVRLPVWNVGLFFDLFWPGSMIQCHLSTQIFVRAIFIYLFQFSGPFISKENYWLTTFWQLILCLSYWLCGFSVSFSFVWSAFSQAIGNLIRFITITPATDFAWYAFTSSFLLLHFVLLFLTFTLYGFFCSFDISSIFARLVSFLFNQFHLLRL